MRSDDLKISAVRLAAWAVIFAAVIVGCNDVDSPPPTEAPAQPEWEGVIAAVGDSLTEGLGVAPDQAYPALLQQRLLAADYRFRVVNAGISGETSSGALSRIDWALTLNPDIVILETGANDGLRGLSTMAMRANIDAIIAHLKEKNVVVVLAGMKMVGNLGEPYVRDFESVYRELAAKHDVALIPFILEGVAGNPRLNQADGIHPNAEGYRRVAETVLPYVETAIETARKSKPGRAAS